jgi:hypothetical protein
MLVSDEDGYDPELAKWLQESGHRPGAARPREQESADEILRYLQSRVGQSLRTKEDIDRYLAALKEQQIERARAERRQRLLRETALLLALMVAAGVNHYMDVQLQIASLRPLLVFL